MFFGCDNHSCRDEALESVTTMIVGMTQEVFSHVLVTRFNSPIGDGHPPASDEWLRERVNLFRTYGLPSIRHQTVKPTRWLLLCHAESPSWFIEELEQMVEGIGEPVWLHKGPSGPLLSELCMPVESPYLITTRMDNDDCVARDFIESIQMQFCEQELEVVNFTSGFQLREGAVYSKLDPSNAFISLIEKVENNRPLTVFMDTHDKLGTHAPLRQVKTHPMWIQVVHGSNIANTIRGIRTDGRLVREHFAVDVPLKHIAGARLAIARALTVLKLGLDVLSKPRRLKTLLRSVVTR